ncbi:MAG TPA: ribose 5-phosphate isomerase B [Gemmatimonadales bacterium]|jgi:ribose 5-phosphate isomerase B|nr:ribose 5-phosphate isomerase B [Gemmatimonadales bacterium]
MAEIIPIGTDHAGFHMKERLKQELVRLGYQPLDLGTMSAEPVDYPDFAHPVASMVEHGKAKRGILLCGSGQGMAYAANRHKGVRAALAWSAEIATVSRSHNDANILVLPSRFLSDDESVAILHLFLDTPFDGGRHERRVEKIEEPVSS